MYTVGAEFCESNDGCMWVPTSDDALSWDEQSDFEREFYADPSGYPYDQSAITGLPILTADNINSVDPQTECMVDLYHLLEGGIVLDRPSGCCWETTNYDGGGYCYDAGWPEMPTQEQCPGGIIDCDGTALYDCDTLHNNVHYANWRDQCPGDCGMESEFGFWINNPQSHVLTPGCSGRWAFSSANPCKTLSAAHSAPNKILSEADLATQYPAEDHYDPYFNWLVNPKQEEVDQDLRERCRGRDTENAAQTDWHTASGSCTGMMKLSALAYCIWDTDYSICTPVDLTYCDPYPYRDLVNPPAAAGNNCRPDPSYCPQDSYNERLHNGFDAALAFLNKLQTMPEAPQPDGQCKASFMSIPDLLTGFDNDKLRRIWVHGATLLRELGSIDWRLAAPPRSDPVWDLLSPDATDADLEIDEDVTDSLKIITHALALMLEDAATAMPPTDSSTDRFAQSPWDVTEGFFGEIESGDYVQIATQALELIEGLQAVDWDAAIYGLTNDEDSDDSGGVVFALYIAGHLFSQLHDGMLSYTPLQSPDSPCADANPWSIPSIPDVLLKNIDAGRIRTALDNGAELFSKLSDIDWRVSTENFPSCSQNNTVSCGTPGQVWSNDAGECMDGTYGLFDVRDVFSGVDGVDGDREVGCTWLDYDPVTYEPKDCENEQCCFTPPQNSELACTSVTEDSICFDTSFCEGDRCSNCQWHYEGEYAGKSLLRVRFQIIRNERT